MKHSFNLVRIFLIFNVLIFALIGACLLGSCGSYQNIKLTTACKDALSRNSNIDVSKLTCNVKDSIAYVSGYVYTEDQKQLVIDTLKAVPGITDVRATLQIEEGGEKNPVMLWF